MIRRFLVPDSPREQSLLSVLRDADVPIRSDCGGHGHCGKCRVRFVAAPPDPAGAELELISEADLEGRIRLACQHLAVPGTHLELKDTTSEALIQVDAYHGRELEKPDLRPGEFGLAVDIGTTTVAVALVDLGTLEVVASASQLNPQAAFGADVLSRVTYTRNNGVAPLRDLICGALVDAIRTVTDRAGAGMELVSRMTVCGNTTMMYIFRGLDPYPLSVFPFTAEHVALSTARADHLLNEPGLCNCTVTLLPGISAYVGADIVSGLYFIGADLHKGAPGMLVDIGTNGEIALVTDAGLVCTATAAGPAFEGANIGCGVGSINGAVSRIWSDEHGVQFETIRDQPPVGLCGSAIVDLLVHGLDSGRVDRTGRLCGTLDLPNDHTPIAMDQNDVRNLQLAKAAIRTGMQMMLRHAGLVGDDIKDLWIAGGFGRYLDKANAVRIGLLPAEAQDQIRIIGNSALGGAIYALSDPELGERCAAIINSAVAIDLSSQKEFNKAFIRNIHFPAPQTAGV